jgi:hypothetical protein
MRSRLVLLVVAILLVAGFAALNWGEVIRPAPLLFGPVVMDAPLGAILLGLLALAVIAFALSAGAMRTRSLMESRHHYKELEAQRLLADKAEASRFTELRTYLDENLRNLHERDAVLNTEYQRELRAQMEQTNRMLSARLNELEHRLESRFERMGLGRGPAVPPVLHDEPAMPMREHPVAQDVHAAQAREAQLREEERLRDERIREERELRRDDKVLAADRPPETGWRRWF